MFGKKLKELRLEKNINQSELGKIIGISPSAIGMYEREQRFPDKNTLLKIADYFDVTVDYLLRNNNNKTLKPESTINDNTKKISSNKININDDLPDEAYDKINEYIKMIELIYRDKDK